MGAYSKLRWKQALNEFRFLKEEYDILESLSREAAPLFQEHYESVLHREGLNLEKLNQENADKISAAYELPEPTLGDISTPAPSADCTEIARREGSGEVTTDQQLSEDEAAVHAVFSKLFKSIALQIHPDKISVYEHDVLQRQEMAKDFRTANRALKEKSYFVLLDIAEKLKIPLPKNYPQQTRWLKNEIISLKADLNGLRRTYNCIFATAETEEEKDEVIRQFVKQLFGLTLS